MSKKNSLILTTALVLVFAAYLTYSALEFFRSLNPGYHCIASNTDHADAISACTAIIKAGNALPLATAVKAHLIRGQMLMKERDFEGARPDLEFIMTNDPGDPRPYLWRATLNGGYMRWDEAIKDIESAIALISAKDATDYGVALCLLGSFQYSSGNIVEAKNNINRSIALIGTKPIPFLLRAQIEFDEENYASAL